MLVEDLIRLVCVDCERTIDSFEQLFDLVDELEVWLKQGKLDNVSPGEPLVNPADLESFLEASEQIDDE